MKQQSFDDIIRKKTDNYRAPVPAGAWENIMQGKKKKRKFILFWWWLALLMIGGGLVVLYNNNTRRKVAAENKIAVLENNSPQPSVTDNKVEKKEASIINRKDSSAAANKKTIETPTVTAQVINTTINLIPDYIAAGNPIKAADNKKEVRFIKQATGIKNETRLQLARNLLADSTAFSTAANQEGIEQTEKINGKQKEYAADEKNIIQYGNETTFANDLSAHSSSIATIADSTGKTSTVSEPVGIIQTETIMASVPIEIKTKSSAWKIDIAITPFLSFQPNNNLPELKRITNTPGYTTEFIADEIHTIVKPGITFTLALRKKLNKKIVLGAGLQYSVIKEKVLLSGTESITNYSIIKRLVKDSNGDYLVNDTAQTIAYGKRKIEALNSYTTFSVPLFLQVHIMTNRFYSLQFSTGIYMNVFRNYKNSIEGNFINIHSSSIKPSDMKTTMGIDIFAGLRFATIARKKWGLFAEPGLRFSLLKNTDARIINGKSIHRAGITVGVSYSL
jgi:cytoskeletal protein RodZ